MSIVGRIKLIVLTIAFTLIGVNMFIGALSSLKSIKRLEDLKKEVAVLESRRNNLKSEIEYKNTQEFIEEKARNDLNLIKPGEKVYVVSGLESDTPFSSEQEDFKQLSKSSERIQPEVAGATTLRTAWYDWYALFFK